MHFNNLIFFLNFCQLILERINKRSIGRTSDGGNGNHSVSLPIILIKMKVDQMLPSSYISSLLVFFYYFAFVFLFP